MCEHSRNINKNCPALVRISILIDPLAHTTHTSLLTTTGACCVFPLGGARGKHRRPDQHHLLPHFSKPAPEHPVRPHSLPNPLPPPPQAPWLVERLATRHKAGVHAASLRWPVRCFLRLRSKYGGELLTCLCLADRTRISECSLSDVPSRTARLRPECGIQFHILFLQQKDRA